MIRLGSMCRAGVVAALAIPLWPVLPSAPAAAPSAHVSMAQYAFAPASRTITAGTRVTWMNHDDAKHDAVTTDAPAPFRSPLLDRGRTWSFTFTVPGTYRYYCSVHPEMRAVIIVRPAPPPTVSSPTRSQRKDASAGAQAPAPVPSTGSPTSVAPATPTNPADVAASAPGPGLKPLLTTAVVTMLAAIFSLLVLSTRPRPAEPG